MIRSLFICSALVASSAAGAVALSALHDATGDRQVRTLAPAPVASVEPRFVLPKFAPVQRKQEVMEVALRDAPSLPQMDTIDAAPQPLAEPLVSEQVLSSAPESVVASTVKRVPVATTSARDSGAMPKSTRIKARAPRNATQPIIVAQAPSFTAQQSGALQPDWVIGVYR